MSITYDQFVQNLEDLEIMNADEVRAFWSQKTDSAEEPDPQSLAGQLVRARKLTKYQAVRVYQNKHQGLMLDKYLIEEQIGRGGMGVVFRARHRRMNRLVAIKILPRSVTHSEQIGRRFQREVEAAAKLIHPNIVTAFDADKHKGRDFLVMEYVKGKNLAEWLKETGPFTVSQALDCVIQAARGLQYAHETGVIHRDIKPQNMLLDSNGCVKILDMGLVSMEETESQESSEDITQNHQIMGSIDYMSPEQAEDISNVDARADIYSLGCTFFRLLTGVPLYKHDKLIQKLVAHRQAPIPSLLDFRDDVPENLNQVFQRMVAKVPVDRQQSMSEVVKELEACQLLEDSGVPVTSAVTATETNAFEVNGGTAYSPVENVDVDSAMLRFVKSLESQAPDEPPLEDDSVIATETIDDVVTNEIVAGVQPPSLSAEATVQREGDSETMPEFQVERTSASQLSRKWSTDKRIIFLQVVTVLSVLGLILLTYRLTRSPQLLIDWPVYDRADVMFRLNGILQDTSGWSQENPIPLAIYKGEHKLEFTRAEFEPIEMKIKVGRGERVSVRLNWIPKDSLKRRE